MYIKCIYIYIILDICLINNYIIILTGNATKITMNDNHYSSDKPLLIPITHTHDRHAIQL